MFSFVMHGLRCACALFSVLVVVEATLARDLPNVVFILADDMGYGDVSCYYPRAAVKTPHIDGLAANGVRFTNGHSPASVCAPTRYGILTGRAPARAERIIGGRLDGGAFADGRRVVANVFDDAGYRTAMIGKWQQGMSVATTDGKAPRIDREDVNIAWDKPFVEGPCSYGFDEAFFQLSSADAAPYKFARGDRWAASKAKWLRKADFPDLDQRDLFRDGWGDPDWNPSLITRRYRDEAVKFIRRASGADDPFFLYLALPAPHGPIAPHPDYRGTTSNEYTDYIVEVDGVVGAIVGALREEAVLGDTIIVFTSDNGASQRYDGSNGEVDGTPLRGYKFSSYEGGHRVPFIIRWSDGDDVGSKIARGQVSHDLIDQLDFYATAAELVGQGLGPKEGEDSFSLLPVLLGEAKHHTRRVAITNNNRTFRHIDPDGTEWKLIGGDPRHPFNAARAELYNLTADVGETRNLLEEGDGAVSKKAESLRSLLAEFIAAGRTAQEKLR
jgi:arylsulfatase A-like enzyme